MKPWKLTKKLPEARSDPRESALSQSLSASTISPDVKAEKASITSSSTKILIHYEVPSEITPIQLENQPRPGILVVTLYEGAGLATSDQYKQVFNCYKHDTPAGGNAFMVRRFLPYALLDFDKSQVSSDSLRGTPEDPKWQGDMTPYEFDVSRIAELTVYLYLKNQNAARGSQDKFIGVARMTPRFEESHEEKAPDAEWLDVQDGTGKIRIRVEYVENRTLKPKVSNYYHHTGTVGSVMQVRKYDTKRLHALKYIPKANIISEVAHAFLFQINHPFIAPLALAFQTPEKIYLFSPFVRGGHLFAHLQREQRFDIDRSRFYIAEILCALEYLHRFNIIYCDLKPRNIVLDLLGHITICDFGLCKLEKKDEDRTTTFHGTLEYPAPELLLGQGYTETVDWWTLGAFLYEMLTGLPQFYDEDTNEIQRKILSEPLYFPGLDIVSLSAKDILTKLLNRNPEQRLGANGASEIKAHPFFHCIDWHKLLLRKCEPPFKPLKNGPMLHQRRHTPQPQEWEERVAAFRESQKTNTLEKDWTLAKDHKGSSELLDKDFAAEGSALSDEANPTLLSNLPQAAVEEGDNGWVLVWRDTAQAFHFYNRSTNTIQSVNPRLQDPRVEVEAPAPQNLLATRPSGGGYDPAIHGDYHPTVTVHNSPSQSQIQDALEAALTAGYHKRVIAQLLSYSIDLNFEIFRHTQKKMTPLEWATEHENLHLVETFLDNGADANFTFTMFPGRPALRRAVQKGNHRLVSVLVQKTNRLPCTKALGLAVDQQDSTIVKILLANGVHCDFEESDRTAPRHPEDIGQYHHDSSEATEFMPPLVRAVNLGNIDLVRLLLANGADANVEYHDLIRPLRYPRMQEVEPCGRAIQLAMDLGQRETVDLLLDSGADIGLPQPVWRFHECSAVPRETYLKITASLRAAAAAAVA